MATKPVIPGEGWTQPTVFQLGKGKTLAVPMTIHETARRKLVSLFKSQGIFSGVVLLQGGEETNQYDTDTSNLFRCVYFVKIYLK